MRSFPIRGWSYSILAALLLTSFARADDDEKKEEVVRKPPLPAEERVELEAKKRAEEGAITDVPLEQVEAQIARAMERVKARPSDLPALDRERKRRVVHNLGSIPHPKTKAALEKFLSGKYDPGVKAAAAIAMGHMKFAREDAAKFLDKRISKEWKNAEVLVGIATGLGELREIPDRDHIYRYFKHKDDAVYVSMIDCLGAVGTVEGLPKLYEVFAQYGKVSTAGVSVRVDTGAAGSKDQQAAASRGGSMLRKARVDRREGALLAVQDAVERITGNRFEFHDQMHEWLEEHVEVLQLKKLPRKR